MKWVKLQTFDRYVLWKNTKNGCRECFWPEIDPNKVSFTEEEKIILKNVDKKYSYIARDEDGSIQLFEVRPFKIDVTQGYYEADGTHYNFNCYKNIFSKITYKNGPVQFRSDEDDD